MIIDHKRATKSLIYNNSVQSVIIFLNIFMKYSKLKKNLKTPELNYHEASRGAVAQSVTVKPTGSEFDSRSRK